ncbi:MAG: GspH/FimT family pseudopilin [Paludibacterium sp.]|uniref:pilus assembly FimT family protein n=1 Tax=Paludibacterium sp. TaxID=1917523 RepID=UPI0025F362F6|nr:GspH/FimT family pseudopilin [Paludibacterium sp.]MBV8048587.1 GspH/FimT family pseudopilin [Paludibacterium sp.]MBV8647936.1 GspH/FimT family pseudopilin [Paludibacterium sp.]
MRTRGFSLIEMLWVLSLTALSTAMAVAMLTRLLAGARLTASAGHLWSALGMARSEALYSGQPVQVCALLMRRNQRLQGCRRSSGGDEASEAWRQGVLLFADRADPTGGTRAGHYDRREDLRDFAVLPGIELSVEEGGHAVTPDGRYAAGRRPTFELREPRSGACQVVAPDPRSFLPRWSYGAACRERR